MENSRSDITALRRTASGLCFLLDEEFGFRRGLAKELRRHEIEVVEFSNSSRFLDMVGDQKPDIVFINLNSAAPRECVRALMALKQCGYSGDVQLFGYCDERILEEFKGIGSDCSLTMLPPLGKPIKLATLLQIVRTRRFGSATVPSISLNDALAGNLVKFLYQPKLDLRTNAMTGAEMFARVVHPKLGSLTPDQFLKGADEDALRTLSRLALISGLEASARFRNSGIPPRLAININIEDLLQLPINDLISAHRSKHGDWLGLVLEIPERQIIARIGHLKSRFAGLQQSGVSIAIDNVDGGSSCLSILNQMPFSEIKIDRSLVQSCATKPGNATICKTLIQMAHNFGAEAVAVGVSTEEELKMLTALDCDFGQGFLLGKPMSAEKIDLHYQMQQLDGATPSVVPEPSA
jgi:EAL domain-containing protein (putative c-di-GMP-specific phosphodiesterase class I)